MQSMRITRLAQLEAVMAGRFTAADATAAEAARAHQNALVKPRGSLGRLESLAVWYAAWRGQAVPVMKAPAILVFAASHGVARHRVSAFPPDVTEQMVRVFHDGGAAINQLAIDLGAELRIGELTPDRPCADISEGMALQEAEFVQAFSYGIESVAALDGADLLILGEMGIGNTTAAAALSLALFGGKPEDWVGTGTGLDKDGLMRKRRIVAAARDANEESLSRGALRILQAFGGLEMAAIAGAVFEARRRRLPVLLDGYVCTAAASALAVARSGALDHCVVGHCSAELGHRRLLAAIGKSPILDLSMRLGEGSGAAVALYLLRAALVCHGGMMRMSEASVSGPSE